MFNNITEESKARVAVIMSVHRSDIYADVEKAIDSILKEGANKRGNSSRLTQSFHFFMFEPIFSPVNALNQPI
ncbi:hypothetical protein [Escherichia coli]|uniref:hypothetical protein n=1 Tax=Escherichia coli TaxID=562 RepID=UPI0006985932|nr:hypothetical protein [Escherichia coli]